VLLALALLHPWTVRGLGVATWHGAWIAALREPRALDALARDGPPRAVRVLRTASNAPGRRVGRRVGELLAEGSVDAAGRRIGTWRTVYADGTPRTATEYAAGRAQTIR
jgi:hypothetical protein